MSDANLSTATLSLVVPDLELVRCIDAGTYGEVWLARTVTGAWRAVKIVRRDRFETAEPFDREYAGITAYEPLSRSHDGLVDILHVGRNDAEGWFHYVMELADDDSGRLQPEPTAETQAHQDLVVPDRLKAELQTYTPRTLASELKSHGRLPIAQCVEIALSVADGLHYLHQHDLVHRDVKPANVIFVDGKAKLADPGSIKSKDKPRTLIGTEGFIPPEGPGAPQGDVFSLGRLLYEASTGFAAHEFPKAPSDVATWPDHRAWLDLNEVICRACQMAVSDRYPSAGEMRADLLLLQAGRSLRREHRLARRLAHARKAIVSLAVALVALATLWFWQRDNSRQMAALAAANRRGLAQAHLAEGLRRMESGDLARSLTFFMEALKLDSTDPDRVAVHRFRIETVLAHCQRIQAMGVHQGQLFWAALSPDGRRVVTGSADKSARVWDADTGAAITPPSVHSNEVRHVAFDHDGRRFASGSEDGTARVWDAQTGLPLTPPLTHDTAVRWTAFSPDGSLVATASMDGTARLWHIDSGSLWRELRGHHKEVNQIRFSANGDRVVTACDDGTAVLWNPGNGERLASFRHNDYVYCAVFSPDDQRLATGSKDGTARIWNARTGAPILPPFKMTVPVFAVAFSVDGSRLLVAGGDQIARGEACVFDSGSGARISPSFTHGRLIRSAALSPDGGFVATSSDDELVQVWDVAAGKPLVSGFPHGNRVRHVTFSADGRQLLTAGNDRAWRLWDSALPERNQYRRLVEGQGIASASFTQGGKQLLATRQGQPIQVWDPDTWQLVAQIPNDRVHAVEDTDLHKLALALKDSDPNAAGVMAERVSNRLFGKNGGLYHVRFSHDGRRVATMGENPEVQLWDTATGAALMPPMVHPHRLYAVAFSPDDRLLLTACGLVDNPGKRNQAMGDARVWSVASGELLATLPHETLVAVACFSPDGRRFLTASSDNSFLACAARIWDSKTFQPCTPELRHLDGISAAGFSPDGRTVATGGDDGEVRLWSAETGAPRGRVMKHFRGIVSLAFSADGRFLASASSDHTARLWDVATGEAVSPPLRHPSAVQSVQFSPNGRMLVTTCLDLTRRGEARVYRLATQQRSIDELGRDVEAASGWRLAATGFAEAIPTVELSSIVNRANRQGPR